MAPPDRPSVMSPRAGVVGVAVIAALIFIALVWYGSAGVRGADQFWYVADTETLTAEVPNVTNNVFPVSLVPESEALPRPFIHNGPPLYMAASLGAIFGEYWAWVVLNSLFAVVTAWGIYVLVRREGVTFGWLFAVAFLLLPGTVWLATQSLIEPILAGLVLAVVTAYAATSRYRIWPWYVMMVLTVVLFWSRPNFFPLLVLIPIIFAVKERGTPRRVENLLGLSAIGLLGVLAANALFPTSAECSLLQILSVGTEGSPGGSMFCYFDTVGTPTPTVSDFLAKGITALKREFFPASLAGALLWIPLNVALALFAVRLVRRKRDRTAEIVLALVILHFVTVMGAQATPRYAVIIIPALIVSIAPWMAEELSAIRNRRTSAGDAKTGRERSAFSRRWGAGVVIALAVLVVTDAAIVQFGREDSLAAHSDIDGVATALDAGVSQGDRIAVEWADGVDALLIGYAARPHLVLFVLPGRDAGYYDELLVEFGAGWLIGPPDGALITLSGASQPDPRERVEVMEGWVLEAVRENQG